MFRLLSSLAPELIAIGLAFTAGVVVVGSRRLSLLALLVQYLLAGLLLARLIGPQVASVKIIVGLLVCFILYPTAHHLSRMGGGPGWTGSWKTSPTTLRGVFRFLTIILVGLAVYNLAGRYPLPQAPPEMNFACYCLGSMGLLTAVLTEEPLRAGLGLLTFLLGFELFYLTLERSLSVLALLGIMDCLIGLAITYLALVHGEGL